MRADVRIRSVNVKVMLGELSYSVFDLLRKILSISWEFPVTRHDSSYLLMSDEGTGDTNELFLISEAES